MRVTRAQLDDKDYFEKKLEMECYEGELIIQILEIIVWINNKKKKWMCLKYYKKMKQIETSHGNAYRSICRKH